MRKNKIDEIHRLLSSETGTITPAHLELFSRYSGKNYTQESLPRAVCLRFADRAQYDSFKKELAELEPLPPIMKFIYIVRHTVGSEKNISTLNPQSNGPKEN